VVEDKVVTSPPTTPPEPVKTATSTTQIIRESPTYVTNEYVTNPTTVIRETVRESGGGGGSSNNTDSVSRTLFDAQVNATHNSIANSVGGLSDSLAESLSTGLLSVSGNTSLTALSVSGAIAFSSVSGGVLVTDANGVVSTTTIGAANITDNSLDFSKFSNALTVDTTTTFDLDTNSADLNFDNNTFFIDSSTNRVGVGTTSPMHALDVNGVAQFGGLIVQGNATSTGYYYADTITVGNLNGVRVVDGVKYSTIQEAVDDCPSTGCEISVPSAITIASTTIDKSVHITFGRGTYTVTGTITIQNTYGVNIEGAGMSSSNSNGGSTFSWSGADDTPMFVLDDVRDSVFKDFSINANSATPLTTAFYLVNGSGSSVTPTNRTFERIRINGTNGGIGKGIQWALGAGGDSNNSDDTIRSVNVVNYGTAAFSIEHPQSKAHRFYSSNINSGGYGQYGIYVSNGSFSWFGGGGGNNSVTDFYIGAANDVISIEGGNFEGSGRLLETGGPSSAPHSVTITGVRWSDADVNADNVAILYQQRGSLNLIGNLIGAGTNPLEIKVESTGAAYGVAIGNQIKTSLDNPFTGNNAYWTSIANSKGSSSTLLRPFIGGDGLGIGTTSPDSLLHLSQLADDDGLKISGYDNVSSHSIEMFVRSNGTSRLTSSRDWQILSSDSNGGQIASGFSTNVGLMWDAFNQFTFTPEASTRIALSIEGVAAQSADLFNITSFGGSAGDLLTVDNDGSVGIGTTTPIHKLSVAGTVGFSGLTGSSGAGSLCLSSSGEVVYNSGSDSCLPSVRELKHNINELSLSTSTEALLQELNPVSFVYNYDDTDRTRYGFIADEAFLTDKHLVTYDADGEISGLDTNGFLAVIVSAIKDIYAKIAGFAESFTTKSLHTEEFCIGDTCIDENRFRELLEENDTEPTVISTENNSNSNTSTETASTTEEIIQTEEQTDEVEETVEESESKTEEDVEVVNDTEEIEEEVPETEEAEEVVVEDNTEETTVQE